MGAGIRPSNARAREYDPATGRFGAIDVINGPLSALYLSAYEYANNNPVRFTDPTVF